MKSAIRLEKFVHPVQLGTNARLVSQHELASIRKEAHEAGIREGAAAASAAFSSEEARCITQIKEVIADVFFVREDAHRLVLLSLKPLILSLVETMAPALRETTLPLEVTEIITSYANEAPEQFLDISVPTGSAKEISELIGNGLHKITLSEDTSLPTSQVKISWEGGFDLIDTAACSDAVLNAVSQFFDTIEEQETLKVSHAS